MSTEKIGGQIDLDKTLHQKYGEKRHRYPCSVCTAFNSPACEHCKCDSCQVFEDKCPKCKNIPKTLSQYQVMHGIVQPGENWEAVDLFRCQRCGLSWKLPWDKTPSYEACPHCRTVYFLFPYFTGGYKGCLRGAPKPGMNWEKEDVFKCPSCRAFFNVPQNQLPGYRACTCGRTYYCYKSASTHGAGGIVDGSKKVLDDMSKAFRI